jgi:4-hydroxy-3-methylbut-2-en-1-yl diphosphate reductase
VAPDIEVIDRPEAIAAGRDPSLEKAVEVLLEELRQHPPRRIETPPAPTDFRFRLIGRAAWDRIQGMKILLANPRGFCAGVDRAIDIVERALKLFGAPIYVRHEVVHNRYVVDRLRNLGAVFVDELDEVPDGATVIFSAHGVSKAVQAEAERRGLEVFDATCPLVTKVHMEVSRYGREGREVILIGHAGHPEVEGTMGQYDRSRAARSTWSSTRQDVDKLEVRDPQRLAFVTQTTLSVDDTARVIEALKKRFPALTSRARKTSATRRRTARTR